MITTSKVSTESRFEATTMKPAGDRQRQPMLRLLAARITSSAEVVLCALLGIYWMLQAAEYGIGSGARPGPGWWPFVVGAAVLAAAVFVFVTSTGGEHRERIGRPALRPLVTVLMLITAAKLFAVFPAAAVLGVFVSLHVRIFGHFPWLKMVVAGVLTAVFVQVVFVELFQIRFA